MAASPPYPVEREVDDLAALIDQAGSSAFLYGYSSGGLLAVHAAASGLPISKLAPFEPPIETDDDRSGQAAFTAQRAQLTEAGRRDAAVEHFLTGIGVPDEMMAQMHRTPSWPAVEAVTHALVPRQHHQRGDNIAAPGIGHRPDARREQRIQQR